MTNPSTVRHLYLHAKNVAPGGAWRVYRSYLEDEIGPNHCQRMLRELIREVAEDPIASRKAPLEEVAL